MSCADIIQHPSPNFGPRRDGLRPSMVVLHYTAMENATAALERLCAPKHEVSAHYLICRTGKVFQLVPEDMRAWHAGVGEWAEQEDINSRSIGIELDNDGASPFSEPQMSALEGLLRRIQKRWDIKPNAVIGHSDMAPGRKFDPGAHFDWARLALLGLASAAGCDAAPKEVSDDAFRARARAAGFTAEVDDATLLAAMRLRFRPWGHGALSAADFRALPG